jgi:hypothetical protein
MRRLHPNLSRALELGPPRLGRLGQQSWVNELESLFEPTPGGGSIGGASSFVNAEGGLQDTPDPSAGSSNPFAILFNDVAPDSTTAVATTVTDAAAKVKQFFTGIPAWAWWAGAAALGFAALSLTTGFKPLSWLNKNPRGRRRPVRRRRSRRR